MKRLLNYTQEIGAVRGASEFNSLHPMLQAVFFCAASYLYAHYGKAFLITSMLRDGSGVHVVWRGLDADVCEGQVYVGGVLPSEAEAVADHVNKKFRYDPERPEKYCCFYGWRDPSGRHDNHVHFQVHPRTVPI